MNKFLKQSLLLIFLVIASICIIDAITSYISIKNANFSLENEPRFLVLGHSQTQHALNDSLIDNLENLSEGGEAYFYTYHKTKNIIQNNSSVHTVFIGFSNNSIDPKMTDWTWDEYYMGPRLEQFSALISIDDRSKLFFKNPTCYIQSMGHVIKTNLKDLAKGDLVFSGRLGGYKYAVNKKEKSMDSLNEEALRIKQLNDYNPLDLSYSNVNIEYLRKLINHCRSNEKKVILVRLPQRSDYAYWDNEQRYQRLRQKYFADVEYLDLSNFKLDDNEFLDASHINGLGAKRFSRWFNEFLIRKYNRLN